jgi:hypothetical protein
MANEPPPPQADVDSEISFSWPGQQRKGRDQGVLEGRVAARRGRLAQTPSPPQPRSAEAPESRPAPEPAPPSRGANLPATRQPSVAEVSERWIVTELRRQALSSESALRDVSERIDQLSRTLRQVVEYLPRLQQRMVGGAPSAASRHSDAVVSHRIDELEARIEARFDELAGAASELRAAGARGGGARPAPVDTAAIKAQVHEAMGEVTKQLADMGDRLRAELVTAAGQAEARLNRDRDQLRETLNQTMGKLNELAGGGVSRDDLRQYWVEMAAMLSKQQEAVVAEREQLRRDLAERLDQMAAEREQLRVEVGERLARVAEAAAVRDRAAASDTKPIAAASAAQKAAIDELRRELHQLGAQLLAATNPKNRPAPASGVDDAAVDAIKSSMAQAASALASAASKDDMEALRNQLAGTVTRLEKALVNRVQQDQQHWEEQLGTALEAVNLSLQGVELNRRAMLAEVSAAVRAAMQGLLPGR